MFTTFFMYFCFIYIIMNNWLINFENISIPFHKKMFKKEKCLTTASTMTTLLSRSLHRVHTIFVLQ